MSTPSHLTAFIVTEAATFIRLDYHKRHSVWHAIDAASSDLGKGRIEHHSPHDLATLVKRWPNPRVVFEPSMNCHWLYEELEQHVPAERLTLANPFKTRIITEAQVKTEKIDARILALLIDQRQPRARAGQFRAARIRRALGQGPQRTKRTAQPWHRGRTRCAADLRVTAREQSTGHLDRNDITLAVQAADSLTGPWTNLASNVNGAAFSAVTPGATVNETRSDHTRGVTVCDVYQVTDPAHPKRFMRLEVTGKECVFLNECAAACIAD